MTVATVDGGSAAYPAAAGSTVAAAMVTHPKVTPADATVGALRVLFASPKVHAAVLVDDDGRLVAVVDRAEVEGAPDDAAAAGFGTLRERVVRPGADLDLAWEALLTSGRRRLAVADDDGRFLGLVCLKRTRRGFCSDRDVEARSRERASGAAAGRPVAG